MLVDVMSQMSNKRAGYYARFNAAKCPQCGRLVKPYSRKPWDGSTRLRYHHCDCGLRFKSIQKDLED